MCGCGNNSLNNVRTLKDVLTTNIGSRCVCEFQHADNIVRRTGMLAEVGDDYIRLKSLNNSNSITSPISTLLSIQFN